MKIEQSLNPNCSEAVFRFYTLEPKKIHAILQAIADEVGNYHRKGGVKEWVGQKVPLFKTAEEYDSNYGGKPSYSFMYKDGKRVMSQEKGTKKAYPKGALIESCAGLGDNEAIVTVEKVKKAFVLNIGNNDISDNKTDWVGKIRAMGIKVRYTDDGTKEGKALDKKYARDCTCGVNYNFGHEIVR